MILLLCCTSILFLYQACHNIIVYHAQKKNVCTLNITIYKAHGNNMKRVYVL